MKTIIAGRRTFGWTFNDDGEEVPVQEHIDLLYYSLGSRPEITEIVSGCAKGADSLGEEWALEANKPVKRFPAEWHKYKKAAGPIRNMQMGDYADQLIAFWDGESKGTQHMINYMNSLQKPVTVIRYDRTD